MGGLAPVVAFLGRQQPPALQARAAHLLGTATSNNNVRMPAVRWGCASGLGQHALDASCMGPVL